MGIVEIIDGVLWIRSTIVTYGHAANEEITERMRLEIETMWNEPHAVLFTKQGGFPVRFEIKGLFQPEITNYAISSNVDPQLNFIRVEEFAHGNISFVDGLGCNSGYFKLENLYEGSTTAAHEYGHTIGLDHPQMLDIRGRGVPGIMYPRGTLVDPQYQYEPDKPAGAVGGTMHPMYRKVRESDVLNINFGKLRWENGRAILGQFTNVWHPDHADIPANFR